jgi:hypothetical protein
MAIEDLREIGNVLYERRADGMLYPVRRVRPDTEARGVPAQDPSLLNVGGIGQRLGLLNQFFNPVEAIGQSMNAGERMMSPNMGVMDRLAALGDMLSGVAGVTGPAVVAGRAGVPAAAAVMEGLLGGSPTQQAAGDTMRAVGRDVVERLNQPGQMPTTYANPIPGLRLYQGSPHNFNAERLVRYPDGRTEYIVGRPDVLPDVPAGAEVLRDFPLGRQRMDKIGTGEGAQAYGYGLYGAEAEGIARGYRDALSRPYLATADGQNIAEKYGSDVADIFEMASGEPDDMRATVTRLRQIVKQNLDDIGVPDVSQLKSEFYGDLPSTIIDFSNRADRLENLLNSGDVKLVNEGKLYELNINANPEDFLDWDKPLSEQSQRVRDVLGQFGMKYDEAASNDFDNALLAALFNDAPGPLPKRPINPTGNDIYMRSTLRNFAVQDDAGRWGPGASTYDESLAAAGGDPKRVRAISTGGAPDRSEALRRAGIPGIRYLDAGSRSAGDGSRNYVVFDENLIEIVRKYGIAGAAAMLGISQADVAQAMQQQQQQQPQGLLSGAP